MAKIEIYSSMFCPFCHRAKALGAEFDEIDVDMDPDQRAEMMRRANGQRTVPQIFIDGRHVGGSDELAALDRAGNLDGMLEGGG